MDSYLDSLVYNIPQTVLVSLLGSTLVSGDVKWAYYALIVEVFGYGLNRVTEHVLLSSKRAVQAEDLCKSGSLYAKGSPSAQIQILSLCITLLYFHIKKTNPSVLPKRISIFCLATVLLGVCFHRIRRRCRSAFEVWTGALIGILTGVLIEHVSPFSNEIGL